MEKQRLLNADYLDIIFDNRNKKYGGYELRQHYPERAKRATYIVLLAAGMLSSIPVIAGILGSKNRINMPMQMDHTITIVNTQLPKEPQQPKPVTKSATVAAIAPTVAVLAPRIVPNDLVPDDVPKPVDSLGDRMIGRNNNDGHAGALVADNGQLDGDGPIPKNPPVIDPPVRKEIMIQVSQMPEFEGDVAGYLQKHLNYPEQSRQNGEEGRSVVKFVVNEDGTISNSEIVRSSGFPVLDNEALRVVSAMPHWKPGKQQGVPVKVYFNLPITFHLD